jgi:hypothetical protein
MDELSGFKVVGDVNMMETVRKTWRERITWKFWITHKFVPRTDCLFLKKEGVIICHPNMIDKLKEGDNA